MVAAVDLGGAGGAAGNGAARPRDRQRRIGQERVLHREHLHLDGARRVGRVADLEDERAGIRVEPEVAVPLALERRRFTLEAEDRAGDLGRERRRHVGRTRFEDVVAHGAPRYRGLRHGRACAMPPPALSARWRPSRSRTAPLPWSP